MKHTLQTIALCCDCFFYTVLYCTVSVVTTKATTTQFCIIWKSSAENWKVSSCQNIFEYLRSSIVQNKRSCGKAANNRKLTKLQVAITFISQRARLGKKFTRNKLKVPGVTCTVDISPVTPMELGGSRPAKFWHGPWQVLPGILNVCCCGRRF